MLNPPTIAINPMRNAKITASTFFAFLLIFRAKHIHPFCSETELFVIFIFAARWLLFL